MAGWADSWDGWRTCLEIGVAEKRGFPYEDSVPTVRSRRCGHNLREVVTPQATRQRKQDNTP